MTTYRRPSFIVLLALSAVLALGACSAPPSPTPPPMEQGVTADGYPYQGSLQAPIMIVEFSDYQCPACVAHFQETLPQLREQYIRSGKVAYVFRQLPNPAHANAFAAAEASLCAADQGQFWVVHDRLFETHAQWGAADAPAAFFGQMAQELGLDRARFDACLSEHQAAARVDDDVLAAYSRGARGTPFFLIQGLPLTGGYPFAEFQALIEAGLPKQ
ncbi:MAG: thioredoxin domain-containing protein [Chloroflexi bacterium]|nr:thioredoxin domain-containing protein [Chloroflexota bacterium]